ncbi:hypothetical protein L504_0488 [Bordetella bronchiseptica F2]|nr:hypothetical protein L507_0459 [Bordetella bronchiseptica CA90 BB02]KDC28856.1 hypothetical protein L504_0488 [Bordetella bronchiseptica F2]KDC32831.1 hypothetical protein L505_0501 [Bordetella bronchiseptica F4563]KDD42615.1 hypothetical protein L529_0451 [Bordetella bronchiseptica MBORD901]KDD44407.1 hypothetical protein L532_0420 [Bordetella bronchiseptica OSU095]
MAEAHVERGALPQAFIDWIVELMRGMRRRRTRRPARMPGGPAAIPPDITGA